MNARTIVAVALGSFAILALPSAVMAQTTDEKAASVQTPVTHEHDHAATTTDSPAAKSCCGGMAQHESHDDGSATPPAQHEHQPPAEDTAKSADGGCCGGMMKGHEHEPAADEAKKEPGHSCCCGGGMKM